MTRKQRAQAIIEWFQNHSPEPETELVYTTPYQLLVAVILSAQCTDKRVNIITRDFFSVFPDVESLSTANESDIYELIKSCSYPNNKAKHLLGMANTVISQFGGSIPEDPDDLQKIPGVGRKTAHVVGSVVFGKALMAVDTHVFRVSNRLGLVKNATTPLAVEKQLVAIFPESLLHKAHHWLILHGRYICKARKPLCNKCGISMFCVFFKDNPSKFVDN